MTKPVPIAPKNCSECQGEAETSEIIKQFAHVNYGHSRCLRCGISFDSNVNEMLGIRLSVDEVREISDEQIYRKLFVETSKIADDKGQVYAKFDWENNQNVKSGVARHVVDVLKRQGLSEPREVLDLGCGNGFTSLELAEAFKTCKIIAVDPSPEVLKVDGQRGVTAFQGTLDSLRFADARFDALIIIGNLMLHTDPQVTIAEAMRVLKPGGLLVIDFKNIHSSLRQLFILLSRIGLSGFVPRKLFERNFINMRFGYSKAFMRNICSNAGLVELECYSKPPRLLEFANASNLQQGLKGLFWRLTDGIDQLRDERAWVQMAWRKPAK